MLLNCPKHILMPIKCIIIDDEQYAIDQLKAFITQIPNLYLHATYLSSVEALMAVKEEDQIDFIFLDIEMPEINGLDLAKTLRAKTKHLVFTTGHSGHAITAFDLKASHYLLKPISFNKFAITIAELLTKESDTVKEYVKPKLQFVKADQKNLYHYIDSSSITHIEAAKNYVTIFTENEQENFITHIGLNHVEEALDPEEFIRIHKSYIVSKQAIRKVEGNIIKLKNGRSFQIGEVYKPAFYEFLKEGLLKGKNN